MTKKAPQPTARDILRARVTELIRAKHLTARQVGHAINKSESQMSLFLSGKRSLSIEAIDAIAVFLGVPVTSLFMDNSSFIATAASKLEAAVLAAFRDADDHTRNLVLSVLRIEHLSPTVAAMTRRLGSVIEEMIGSDRLTGVDAPMPTAPRRGRLAKR